MTVTLYFLGAVVFLIALAAAAAIIDRLQHRKQRRDDSRSLTEMLAGGPRQADVIQLWPKDF